MIETHHVAETDIASLSGGYGGPEVIQRLWTGQESRRLHRLRLVVQHWRGPAARRDAAVATIIDAERRAPGPVRALLVEPMVGVWAAAAVRALRLRGETDGLGHLSGLALSAALRAGVAAEARLEARDGWVYLPGAGRIGAESATPTVTVRDGRLRVDGTEIVPGERWLVARRFADVVVDDVDPYRDTYHVPAADRLSAADFASWGRHFAQAWDLLTRHAPERSRELAAGLQTIVPLSKPDTRAARSATSMEAVGVIGLDRPSSPAELAVTLVHEFQHSKLTALHDIHPLYTDAGGGEFFVPWRTDARPISGAIQGIYAFLGVADTWRALLADPVVGPAAELKFAEARAFVGQTAHELAGSPLLTPAGRAFARGMLDTIESFQAVPVRPAALAAAGRSLTLRRAGWQR